MTNCCESDACCGMKFDGEVPRYYDELFGRQLFEPYAVDLISRIQLSSPPRMILELGCGTGICTKQIVSAFPQSTVYATDISADMVNYAKNNFTPESEETSHTKVNWEVHSCCKLPYKDNMFDLVVCQFGFMFCDDKHLAFTEVSRVLSDGGKLIFNVWGDFEDNPLCFLADEVLESSHNQHNSDYFREPYSMRNKEEVKRLLTTTGFSNIECWDECMMCAWNSPLEAARAIIDGSPISTIIDEDIDIEEIIESIAEKYSPYVVEDGRAVFPMKAVVYCCSSRSIRSD
mmetsp:Transcript_15265/g.22977  ORF Transcript_15265/g.22977 Transcript_15265/m.22977 type:complete len:288 (+) Transcript_15265:59-922(+)|eukprot:CAMPEP_0185020440 /NCGR_PEP_ID=MMETSP1103-20130426/3053_1 /TAXON_ID=36769 /ORGANISM="Paraphysomonas bandaiensis, Strain Caron Lab Isolate" /LENGTH=287 /DNA_ID=CAMNT_0027551347 /DNA_START=52 /DNA_END=915 /DNA_ORIENTATION=-